MKYNIVEDSKMTRSSRLATLAMFGILSVFMFGLAYTASAATIDTQLQLGSRGTEVTELQTYLATNPSFYPQGLITGYYGNLTVAAVKRFQAFYGISQVGRVGPQTMAKLNSLMGGVVVGVDVTAPVIMGVAASITGTSATITWMTDTTTTGRVFYSTTPLQISEVSASYAAPIVTNGQAIQSSSASGTSHAVSFGSLTPNTVYHYFVQAVDLTGNVSMTWPVTFQTAAQ